MDTKQAGSAGNGSKPGVEDPPKDSGSEPIAPPPPTVEDVSDPDEDDLDDLDDLLEEFSGAAIDAKKTTATAGPDKTPAAVSDPAAAQDDLSEEEFQKQLQAGMEELMNDLEKSPDMQAQFENIFKGLGAAAAGSSDDAAASTSKAADKMASDLSQDANFQETIRRTMARMQESGEQATAAAAAGSSEDDFLAEMMKAMKDMPSGDGEEEFSKMLMGMMEQLTNKEILYEPMKELNEKFPGWMTKNKDTLSKEDLKRYQEQQVLVAEMVAKFEETTYADSNAADREYIVDRMQKMQAAGAPPHDLVGDMPSAKEVLDGPDDSCPTQ
ncbi:Pex19 protein family-domain-containing protein [Biscogniauxia mediterranea]|nr:Pex19 protein family-domain-containing protein [Biscogniauxia mediterranea]